jgi:hypothetical protein
VCVSHLNFFISRALNKSAYIVSKIPTKSLEPLLLVEGEELEAIINICAAAAVLLKIMVIDASWSWTKMKFLASKLGKMWDYQCEFKC